MNRNDLDRVSTLREIDAAMGAAKGAAFRVFKRLAAQLREGEDFIQLRAGEDDALISRLRDGRRIYASSVHALLFAPVARDLIVTAWERSERE